MTFSKKIYYDQFNFEAFKTDSKSYARLGKMTTPHGLVETPNFIFCATKGAIKAVAAHQLPRLKTQIILSNTYHLMLQPGSKQIKTMGGLHRFMGWTGPLLTDSGGYQIFAMGYGSVSQEIKRTSKFNQPSLIKITEEGCWFRSYIDGRKIFLSPETSMEVQADLGADLVVQLDECTPYHISYQQTRAAMEKSIRWGDRSLAYFHQNQTGKQAVYGVVQGGVHMDLRRNSVASLIQRPFFGIAIGGSLGKQKEEMYQVIKNTMSVIRESETQQKPVHLLGVGEIKDIFFGVRQGIDTFDCVIPTRIARHGTAIVPAHLHPENKGNKINLKNSQNQNDSSSLEGCSADLEPYRKSYLHHLIKAKEILALQILTEHNIYQMNTLMEDIRKGIKEDRLDQVEAFWCDSSTHTS